MLEKGNVVAQAWCRYDTFMYDWCLWVVFPWSIYLSLSMSKDAVSIVNPACLIRIKYPPSMAIIHPPLFAEILLGTPLCHRLLMPSLPKWLPCMIP